MTQQITLAGGCFWCIEGAFKQVRGVLKAESGYAGGHRENPTYEQVCAGETGHAEVVQITFEPTALSTREILEIFFALHDPTQLNRQGNDVGTQYRSAIFYQSEEQRVAAEDIIAEMRDEGTWNDEIVTEIEPLEKFWPAEDYHDNYVERNPQNAYCQAVVSPKLAKFKRTFAEKLE
ncbi:peptide-methionine (S)-S-oxide reductase MsrA [Pseudidiomarina sp. 1APP75-32.1]|uniref:Peptide methionine sulfoxide reductase MsrA n=1 Tax=Pseudidiomarina terrestris TaxID=2820060 RepID=A0AAW7QW13_9GAMM|nr:MULTISPECIES: peptide-methionine (S)-S-oxide reductase MsrA [unclassified Pseudidiomarina]MDN7124430.1 peptide-methionine (S)-S-oxide reductase MsrA [Pseudidiomarina sp. 1APP75-32.1]MDN7129279.1 peptide-methionine (S)-S-oxide reductase MsrA [Pseudidiomarina sp. 1APR75-15]